MEDVEARGVAWVLGWGVCVRRGENVVSMWWTTDSTTPTVKVRRVHGDGGG